MKRFRLIYCLWGFGAALLLNSGCSALGSGGGDASGVGQSLGPVDTGQNQASVVTVRFVNLTDTAAVDVQFHVSNETIESVPDDLFVDENLVTRSIGLAGSGIIAPRATDAIQIPCAPDLTLGSLGGVFAEAESGDVFGTGQPRWVTEDPVGFCGLQVTFEFSQVDDAYLTRVRIGN